MFSANNPEASLQQLPADAYSHLAPCMSLLGMACTHLFSHPTDVVAQHVTALTGLDAAAVQELNAIDSTPALQRLLIERPLRLFDFVVVGQLCLESPLATPVLAFVQHQMQIDEVQLRTLLEYCQALGQQLRQALEQHLVGPSGAAALAPLHRRAQQLRTVFEQHADSLRPQLPAVVSLGFDDGHLQLLRLALLLVHELRHTQSSHPFLQALPRLTALPADEADALTTRLAAVQPTERLPLTLPELVLLYQAMHVCALAFVSDVLGTLGMEAAFPTTQAPSASSSDGSSRQAVVTLIVGFTRWVEKEFGQEPAVQTARQEITELAETLG
ncbi:hypothetical protein [Hymenobacter crusticola]|uniref:Uncharacterized protein n=1 Tax=Hymenobacter crusticola TaxID=1770526 RepID=A0A243WHL9_9BACT|nr:hypothetical protein [Hymenobacter crusticola]OUJ75305.1 hypothetical protein BXP70_04625 [Hymenobacter crusticola]